VEGVAELEQGREAYERHAWVRAYESLTAADGSQPLRADDLERLATSAYMTGHERDYLALLERAYRDHLDAGRTRPALRCAFWISANLARRGDVGSAGGWLGRARRLLDQEGDECAEHGYLLLATVFEQEARGEWDAAVATAAEVVAIGERFGDADLFALAAHERGHVLILRGRLAEGLALLDETMIAVIAGDLSPIVAGIVYCGVILACQDAHEVRRAREWTAMLTQWCDEQPEMVAFTGRCRIHRAEILQLHGAWHDALAEARRAAERALAAENEGAAGEACYRQGEVHRLLGNLRAAEDAYKEASRRGREPQPGLALVRLAQGNAAAAEAAIRRVAQEVTEPGMRVRFLPAYVEIMLVGGDVEAAREACRELERIAGGHESGALGAMAAQARGATELAGGDPWAVLAALRRAGQLWQELGAPYDRARVQMLVGLACRALGDADTATLELDTARAAFAALSAAADLARLDALAGTPPGDRFELTARELEVLRLVAGGNSNREIATALVISPHTVARHLQNIYAKLRVSSRTAASAFAFEHRLV
jgi:DNA-binding CsgD family transcriptional regulator